MQHGYINQEVSAFVGLDQIKKIRFARLLDGASSVRVGHVSYHFYGYMTSILSMLQKIPTKSFYVEKSLLEPEMIPGDSKLTQHRHGAFSNTFIMVEITYLTPGGAQQLVDRIRGGIGGGLGFTSIAGTHSMAGDAVTAYKGLNGDSSWLKGVSEVRSVVGGAMDVKTVYDRGRQFAPAGRDSRKPGKMARLMDKSSGNKVHIRVGCHFNETQLKARKVLDTWKTSLTCADLATILPCM